MKQIRSVEVAKMFGMVEPVEDTISDRRLHWKGYLYRIRK